MFSQRHFIAIAAILKDAGLLDADRAYIAGLFADKFAADNPSFKRARFLKASGVEN